MNTMSRNTHHYSSYDDPADHSCDHNGQEFLPRDRPMSGSGDIFRDIGPVLKDLLEHNQLCDGIVRTEDGKHFDVHCTMLSAVSPYFRSSFISLPPSAVKDIIVPNIPSDIMTLILDFAYTGKVAVTTDNVERLMLAANQVKIPEIAKLCINFLSRDLKEENCINIFLFAKHYSCIDLQFASRNFLLSHFYQIFGSNPEFLCLSIEDLESLLRSDHLNIRSEESAFHAAIRWVEQGNGNRLIHLSTLLSCVRFGLCSFEFFSGTILTHPYIADSQDCQATLYATSLLFVELQSRPDVRPVDMHHPLLRPRIPNEIIFAIGGWSTGSATNVMETYDIRSDRWFLSLSADNMPRAYHGLVALDGLIYMLGGFDGNQCFNTMRCYDPVGHEWKERACMYTSRCYISVATVNGCIYALGGYDGHARVNTGERYEPQRNQWHMIASMNHIRSDASASALNGTWNVRTLHRDYSLDVLTQEFQRYNLDILGLQETRWAGKGKVYIVGGFNGQQVLNSAEMYNPVSNSWTDIRHMSSPRSGVNLIAYNGALYVIGGFNGTNRLATVERYDNRHDQWIPVPSMSSPRSNFATATIEDYLFVIGGFNGLTTVSYAECYNSRSNVWKSVSDMNLNRSALSACVLKSLPNSREYSYLANADYTN